MTTKARAIAIAMRQAEKTHTERFIVKEDGEYLVATEEELDTFYLGHKPLYYINSEGEIEP